MKKEDNIFENRLFLGASVAVALIAAVLVYACCAGAKELFYGIFLPTYKVLLKFFDSHERQIAEIIVLISMSGLFARFMFKMQRQFAHTRVLNIRSFEKKISKLEEKLSSELKNSGQAIEARMVADRNLAAIREKNKILQKENADLWKELEKLTEPEKVAHREQIKEKQTNAAVLKDVLHHIYEVRS